MKEQSIDREIEAIFPLLPSEFDAKLVGQWLRSKELDYNPQQIGFSLKRLLKRRLIEMIPWSLSEKAKKDGMKYMGGMQYKLLGRTEEHGKLQKQSRRGPERC